MITVIPSEEINKMREALQDCIASQSVIANAIKCGFLEDKHSLIMQEWLHYYEQREQYLQHTLEGAINEYRKKS